MLLPTVYEDAGISGGTLERPGLHRLLADIDAGLVEQVVVYKVDRLTRSLSDFAKLVERLEAAGAVFVSVTPSCAKTQPSRHRRKNCASRNQAKTLAREQVTRRPPTLDCGSTHRCIGCVSFIIIDYRHPEHQRGNRPAQRASGQAPSLSSAVIRPRVLRDRRGGHELYAVGCGCPAANSAF